MADLLAGITEAADELTEPHRHTERIRDWDANRNAKYRTHVTTQPGLLAQLYQAVTPSGSAGEASTGSSFGSRPPLAVEALSCHLTITVAVMDWCAHLGTTVRATVESNLRALVGAAPKLDADNQRALLADLKAWRRWCAVLTGWETLYQPGGVACPNVDCGQANTLRINLTNRTAMCKACGAAWAEDDGSITILADHIRSMTDAA